MALQGEEKCVVLLFQTEFRELLFLDQTHACQRKLRMGPEEIFFFSLHFMPGSEGFDGTLWIKKELKKIEERENGRSSHTFGRGTGRDNWPFATKRKELSKVKRHWKQSWWQCNYWKWKWLWFLLAWRRITWKYYCSWWISKGSWGTKAWGTAKRPPWQPWTRRLQWGCAFQETALPDISLGPRCTAVARSLCF